MTIRSHHLSIVLPVLIFSLFSCSGKNSGAFESSPKTHDPSEKIHPAIQKVLHELAANEKKAQPNPPETFSNPRVRVNGKGQIQTYILLHSVSEQNLESLKSKGVRLENQQQKTLQAWIPHDQMGVVAQFEFIEMIKLPSYGKTRRR